LTDSLYNQLTKFADLQNSSAFPVSFQKLWNPINTKSALNTHPVDSTIKLTKSVQFG